MAIIRKILPDNKTGNYLKYDNRVFLIKDLSDGAKVLYGHMASKQNGGEYSDIYFMKALGLSERTIRNRKKELVDVGLILVDRIGAKNYILYIGFTSLSATEVKRRWANREARDDESLTVNEVIKEQEIEAKIAKKRTNR